MTHPIEGLIQLIKKNTLLYCYDDAFDSQIEGSSRVECFWSLGLCRSKQHFAFRFVETLKSPSPCIIYKNQQVFQRYKLHIFCCLSNKKELIWMK